MDKLPDASFRARLGAFLVDLIVVAGVSVLGGFLALSVITPFTARPNDPVDWISPQAAGAEVLATMGLPLVYVAASWTRLLGHRSLGKRVFRLRVVRADDPAG